jgi:hypothetical protein
MNTHTQKSFRTVNRLMMVTLLAAGILVTTAGALGASSGGCGEYSYGFPGTRLLNDGISDSAGPFTLSTPLPAGTYDITMLSDDNHPSPDYQPLQTQEQWYFTLDSGYQSPPTHDIPNDQTHMVTKIGAVELAAATSITVEHLREGIINSVNVECVGFTPVEGKIAGPTAPPADVKGATTIAPPAPATTIAPAAPPATTAPDSVVDVTPPAPQLAVTGTQSTTLVLLGILLITFGIGCALIERGLTRATSRT